MSDLIFRWDRTKGTLTVFERATGIEIQTLCVLSERETETLSQWLTMTLANVPNESSTHLAKDK